MPALAPEREGVRGVRRYAEERSEFRRSCCCRDAVAWNEIGPPCTGLVVIWTGDPWNGIGPACWTGLVGTWDPWNVTEAAVGWTGLGT